jgi:hypothetical protein
VTVRVRSQRWRCRNSDCERQTFVEGPDRTAKRYARRTGRMAELVRLLGHTAGGRTSERLLARLGMPVSDDTILRAVKRRAATARNPRVVGIDGVDGFP